MLPPFTVIISVYKKDRADWFKMALESIINQTVPPEEVIITQDGHISSELKSSIKTTTNKYPDITFRLVVSETSVGRGDILARAVEEAGNPYIAIMDSDDISLKDRFEEQLEVFITQPSVDVVGTWIDEFEDISLKRYATRKVPEYHDDIIKFAKWRNPLNQMAVMFKKDAVLRAGNYQTLKWLEDMWLWGRMTMQGCKFYNIQKSLVLARAGNEMIKRRSGLPYAVSEFKLITKLYRVGFYNRFQYFLNLLLRIPLRFLPSSIMKFIFIRILRR